MKTKYVGIFAFRPYGCGYLLLCIYVWITHVHMQWETFIKICWLKMVFQRIKFNVIFISIFFSWHSKKLIIRFFSFLQFFIHICSLYMVWFTNFHSSRMDFLDGYKFLWAQEHRYLCGITLFHASIGCFAAVRIDIALLLPSSYAATISLHAMWRTPFVRFIISIISMQLLFVHNLTKCSMTVTIIIAHRITAKIPKIYHSNGGQFSQSPIRSNLISFKFIL